MLYSQCKKNRIHPAFWNQMGLVLMDSYEKKDWYIKAKKAAEKKIAGLDLSYCTQVIISKVSSGWVFHCPEIDAAKAEVRSDQGIKNYQNAIDAFVAALQEAEEKGVKTLIVYGYSKPRTIELNSEKLKVIFAPGDSLQCRIFAELIEKTISSRNQAQQKP